MTTYHFLQNMLFLTLFSGISSGLTFITTVTVLSICVPLLAEGLYIPMRPHSRLIKKDAAGEHQEVRKFIFVFVWILIPDVIIQMFFVPRAYLTDFDFPVHDQVIKSSPFFENKDQHHQSTFESNNDDSRRIVRKADLEKSLEAAEEPVDYYNRWILENMG